MTKLKNNEVKLEDALDRLEKIISKLQNGNLSLDESLENFEEGIGFIRICQEKLDNAECKIAMLLKDNSGNFKEVPFDIKAED